MAGSSQYTCPGMGESCGCSSRLHEVLEKHIGYDSFLPGQLGSGKSLCMFKAVGVIISPLNGLMEEQVIKLQSSLCSLGAVSP